MGNAQMGEALTDTAAARAARQDAVEPLLASHSWRGMVEDMHDIIGAALR